MLSHISQLVYGHWALGQYCPEPNITILALALNEFMPQLILFFKLTDGVTASI